MGEGVVEVKSTSFNKRGDMIEAENFPRAIKKHFFCVPQLFCHFFFYLFSFEAPIKALSHFKCLVTQAWLGLCSAGDIPSPGHVG